MKGSNVFACVMLGVAATPLCAYRFRPSSSLVNYSADQWFVSAIKGQEASPIFALAAISCAVIGCLIGLVLVNAHSSDQARQARMSLLRTPVAASVLIPLGIATALVITHNLTLQVLDRIVVWPEFYFKNLSLYSAAAAVVGAIMAGLLNTCENAFERAPVLAKAAITCCLPLAICFGAASMAGLVGGGLLVGTVVGRLFECPLTGAWIGVCLAVALLATQGSVLWPRYCLLEEKNGR